MLILEGKYNKAKIFTDHVEETAVSQIIELCNQEFTEGSTIRIMPDTHAGAGCTIGTTMTIKDKIVPNLVGVDIGCGMAVMKIETEGNINFDQLDSLIRKYVPSGFSIHNESSYLARLTRLDEVIAPINKDRAEKSIGTLGGGNHFIEINQGSDGSIYLVIHSGSRNLGKQVAEYYQNLAYERLIDLKNEKQRVIDKLKSEGRVSEIQKELNSIKVPKIKKELAYLEGQGFADYMHDMKIAQHYAYCNRLAMSYIIMNKMGWLLSDRFDTIHNYIDMDHLILRKGAISARKDERVIIPMNMRDGSIIAVGKGNEDWNQSAPHGAGRLMSRSKAKENVSLEEFKESMTNVWTSSVCENTIDESPMVYKPMDEIIKHTQETINIVDIIKPLYNFKAN